MKTYSVIDRDGLPAYPTYAGQFHCVGDLRDIFSAHEATGFWAGIVNADGMVHLFCQQHAKRGLRREIKPHRWTWRIRRLIWKMRP